ncbi:MAG: TonB family protein [Candidatus Acidiferrales bacterium]|jgi:protein TonB
MAGIAAHASDSAPSPDRRLYSRQPIQSLAYVELDEGNGGIVLNASEGGLCVHAAMILMEDKFPHLRFQLAESKDWIETSARIAWTNESKKVAGLEFLDVPEPTRARLRECLSLEIWSAKVAEAWQQEESTPSELSQSPLPPTVSPSTARPADEPFPTPRPPAARERLKNAPASSETAVVRPPAVAAPLVEPGPPAPVYMFGRILSDVHNSGGWLARNSRPMWILAGFLLSLAVVSVAAGRGTFGGFFSAIPETTPSSDGQQENVTLPSVRPAPPISEIEIVDANNERWVIPFIPPGTGIEEKPHEQTPIKTPERTPVRTPARRTVKPPAPAPGFRPSPSGENTALEEKSPAVSPAPLSDFQNVSPSPASTKSHMEVPQPLPVPDVPQAGVLQPGEIVHRADPIYPEYAQTERIEGTVKLRVSIGADGTVRDVTVISGPGPLVEAAIAAVRQWLYTPTLLDGKPVEAEEYVSIVFQLPPASK